MAPRLTNVSGGFLWGRNAVVTGGGSGIGRAVALGLARHGATVVGLGRSVTVQRMAEAVAEHGLSYRALRADLSDRDVVPQAFDEVCGLLGGLDILVNSHGTATSAPSLEQGLDDWDRTLEVNGTSLFELCQLAGRRMVPAGTGKIIYVASMYAFFGGLRVAGYTASKGGVA